LVSRFPVLRFPFPRFQSPRLLMQKDNALNAHAHIIVRRGPAECSRPNGPRDATSAEFGVLGSPQ